MAWSKGVRLLKGLDLSDNQIKFLIDGLGVFDSEGYLSEVAMKEISSRCDFTPRTARNIKNALIEMGYLIVIYRFNSSSVYNFHPLMKELGIEKKQDGGDESYIATDEKLREKYPYIDNILHIQYPPNQQYDYGDENIREGFHYMGEKLRERSNSLTRAYARAHTYAHTGTHALPRVIESNLIISDIDLIIDSNLNPSLDSNLVSSSIFLRNISSESAAEPRNTFLSRLKIPNYSEMAKKERERLLPAESFIESSPTPPSSAPPPLPKKGRGGRKPISEEERVARALAKEEKRLAKKAEKEVLLSKEREAFGEEWKDSKLHPKLIGLSIWTNALLKHFRISQAFDPDDSSHWKDGIFSRYRNAAKSFAKMARENWIIPDDVKQYVKIATSPNDILDAMIRWLVENKGWENVVKQGTYSPQTLAGRLLEFDKYWRGVIEFKVKTARQFLDNSPADRPVETVTVPEPVSVHEDGIESVSISKQGENSHKVIFAAWKNGRKEKKMLIVSDEELEKIKSDQNFLMSMI